MSDESQPKIAYFTPLIIKGSSEWLVQMKTPTIMNMLGELKLPQKVLSKRAGMDTGFGTHQFSSTEIPSGGFTLKAI